MRTETFQETLPVKLTETERNDRGRAAAAATEEIKAADDALEAFAEEMKSKKKALETVRDVARGHAFILAERVRTGMEPRLVDCEERENRSSLTIDKIRLDTGEIVGSRAMTPAEVEDKQTRIPGTGAKAEHRGIGPELAALRKTTALTQAQVAAKLGIAKSTYQRIERGEVAPTDKQIADARALCAAATSEAAAPH